MNAPNIEMLKQAWVPFHALTHISHIDTEEQYDLMIETADKLVDDGAMDESHVLHNLCLVIFDLIHQYEQVHYPLPDLSGAEMLRFLMDQHHIKQADLSDIASQSVVSEVLSGKRGLTVEQIKKLADRFKVNPAVFL